MFKFTYYNNKSQIIDIFLPILNTVFLKMNLSSLKNNHPLPVFSVFFSNHGNNEAKRPDAAKSAPAPGPRKTKGVLSLWGEGCPESGRVGW